MNKLLFAVGLLSTGLALGQTTGTTSTTTSTSNYNTTNTNNENSRNATMGTNSSTDRPSSTTNNPGRRRGNTSGMRSGTMTQGSSMTPGTSYNSSGSYDSNSGMSSTSTYSSTSTAGTYDSNNTGSSASGSNSNNNTTPSYNSSMGTTTTTNSDMNSMGTGTSPTTPSTTSDYNSANTGTSVTSTTTYSTETTTRPYRTNDYKNFAYGIYVGANTTRFRGESIDTENPSGRVGYQAGFFVRGGGRLFGQIGAEYFASSSNYFRPGDGQSAAAIRDQINIQYIQVPVYIGFKLTESDRGISAIRLQVGAEYANRISSTSGRFNLSNSEIKSGSFNALGQLGFDIGPLLIDLTYHHGLSDAVQINTFQGSTRRILSASVGFKF